jgi:hypothetical protein
LLVSASSALSEGIYENHVKEGIIQKRAGAPGNLDIPPDVLDRFAGCIAKAAVERFTPEEIAQLDANVFGASYLDDYVLEKAQSRLDEIARHTNAGDFSILEAACPMDLADFQRHGL